MGDYRRGEIDPPSPEHVERWSKQFSKTVREPLLEELDHVLKQTYYSRRAVNNFLTSLVENKKIAGDDPRTFWRGIKFLDIQGGGNSQTEMLAIFGAALKKECGLNIDQCGKKPRAFVYLDDAIFTGSRVRTDLGSWFQSDDCPETVNVHVVTIALHRSGKGYADGRIKDSAAKAKRKLTITWWRCVGIEDRKACVDTSDVLWPTCLPDCKLTRAYAESLKYKTVFRTRGNIGENKFFSCEEGRHLLEQEFLKAGAKIRSQCPNLNIYQRPLGNMILETLGFGSLFVTFRNCPNNCPLAIWAGDPWYPLFPRKTN